MVNNPENKSRSRLGVFRASKSLPRLSLNLHTMPQTSRHHWQRWLVLGILILALVVLVAYFLFS